MKWQVRILAIATAAIVFAGSGCTMVPPKQNAGDLITSEGVRKLFEENPGMDVLYADGSKVKCRQITRVGTHIHSRMCLTVEEWEERERALEKTKQRLLAGPCVPSAIDKPGAGRSGTCGEGKTNPAGSPF